MRKRILSILLTLCMVLCIVPTGVFAEGETATGSSAIQSGINGIHGYDADDGYSYIYYGVHNGNPVKWRVLDTKTNTGESDALFLLTDECMGRLGNGYIQFNPADKADRYLWKGSNAQTWCTNFYNSAFTAAERALIPAVTQANSEYFHKEAGTPSYYPGFKYQTGGLEAEYVFAPSIQEINNANYGFATGYSRIAGPFMTEDLGSRYWIRSYFNNLPHYVGEYANMTGDQIATSAAVRPAMNLSTAGYNVLFSSAAVGGKPSGGLQPVSQNYTGNEWKLTLEDSSRLNFRVTGDVIAATDDTTGDTVKIRYTGAKAGANEYVSAIIVGNGRSVTYYGRSNAALTETDGTAELTIPAGFAPGTYTLYVFNEQYNGDCKTDLAGNFSLITLTVTKRVKEQFSLAHGGRYYFDLSAVDMPGTVNSNLPDSTLHYVPFTYAGTVDAYSLKSENDTDTTSYKHSLFIADYNITKAIDWNMLNGKNLLFGKSYTAGNLSYTLRAPSVGRQVRDSHLTPVSNEWDMILLKSDDYIKNQNTIYSAGQDIWANSEYSSVYRGYDESGYMWRFEQKANDNPSSERAYRPVLELPTDLAADSLKVVEVRLGGTKMPGETANWINIIVKKGESFTAPHAEGLPRPDGISADAQLWWVDDNGNYYKAGSTIPADVSSIYPLWGGFGLFLDRGDGAVEVTPDNCSDIFGDGSASFVIPKGESFNDLSNSYQLNETERQKIYLTGRYGENIFPNLKLKNANLTSVTLNEKYIGRQSPLFITPDGKNIIGSINISDNVSALSVLSGGTLTLNSTLNVNVYTQNGVSVTMTDALSVKSLYVFNGSLTVTDDTQAVMLSGSINGYYPLDVRVFAGNSAQDAGEVTGWQLSPEMLELYRRLYAGETLSEGEYDAFISAIKDQWNAIQTQLSGKTYVRIANAWDVTYQPGTDGTGDAVTDIKFYNDILSLRSKLFTRTGYTQVGWATIDGGEKIYGLDAVYTQNEALTLYPVWNVNKYTITFDTAGGSEIASITQDYGTRITAPANPTREGYTFIDWDKEIPATMPAENITIKALWKDTEKPTGEIKLSENSWKSFLNNITFGLFFKDTQTVTINASDNGSGIKTVEYLLSDKKLTKAELDSMTFTAYTAPFGIDPDNEYIIYVRLTDKAGNTDYICSDGIVLDGTNPVINGIENGKIYCEAQTVTIDEKYIDSVKVNGTEVTLDNNNSFTLAPTNGEQKIVVTDRAGNTAEMTVTVNDGHTYEWQSENGEYWQKCKFCYNETAKKAIPEIVIKGADTVCRTQDYTFGFALPEGGKLIAAGYEFENLGSDLTATPENGKYTVELACSDYPAEENSFKVTVDAETADGFAIKATKSVRIQNEHIGGKATCTEKALCDICGKYYGDINANNHANLKHIDAKAATKDSEGNIEYWYCEGCNKYYSDAAATKEIQKADTVIAKLPDNNQKSPKTGDTNNLALWIALLFVNGGVLISVTVFSKKKKFIAKH